MSHAQDEYKNKQSLKLPDKTYEFIESKPNRIFNLYPNLVEKQRDTVLKSSNAKDFHNPTFDFSKQTPELKPR